MNPTAPAELDVGLLMEAREACQSGRARRLRMAAGLSQSELARACDVTEGAIQRWETGTRRPTGKRAIAYGRVLREIADGLVR